MTDPGRHERRVPHWGWGLAATVLLVVAFAGVRIGRPIYQREWVMAHFKAKGAKVTLLYAGPEWLVWMPRWIAPFTVIFSINADTTPVTDEDLLLLSDQKGLEKLRLVGTQVTHAGVAKLKAELPKCEIHGP